MGKKKGPLEEALGAFASLAHEFAKPSPPRPSGPRRGPSLMFSEGELGGLSLDGDEAVRWMGLLDKLKTAARNGGRATSDSFVETSARRAMLRVLDIRKRSAAKAHERVASEVTTLRSLLSKPPLSWTVHLPCVGIGPPKRVCVVGGVRFKRASPKLTADIHHDIERAIDANPLRTPERKQTEKAYWKKDVDHLLSSQVVAVVTVSAVDGEAALELGARQLHDVLLVARLYKTSNYRDGAPREGWQRLSAFGTQLDTLALQSHEPRPDSLLMLDELKANADVQKAGLGLVSGLLARTSKSEVERRVVDALRWAGDAMGASTQPAICLGLTVALERLLLGSHGAKSDPFALRCAHLIGTTAPSRREVLRLAKEAYATRSRIVHESATQVDQRDVSLAYGLLLSAVREILRRRVLRAATLSDFNAWFDRHLLR